MINNLNLIIGISIVLFLIIVAVIVYIMYRDRKQDEEEINDIICNLVEPKRSKKDDVEEVETVERKSEIEEMLEKMQKDLDTKPGELVVNAVANFEQEQEENSIISYQELVGNLKGDVVEPPVKIEPKKPSIEEEKKEIISDKKIDENIKKFKTTDFISPVYGKMDEKLDYPTVRSFENKEQVKFDFGEYFETDEIESMYQNKEYNMDEYLDEFNFDNTIEINSLEQTLNMKPLSAEVKENDEFLSALKDFRKNL